MYLGLFYCLQMCLLLHKIKMLKKIQAFCTLCICNAHAYLFFYFSKKRDVYIKCAGTIETIFWVYFWPSFLPPHFPPLPSILLVQIQVVIWNENEINISFILLHEERAECHQDENKMYAKSHFKREVRKVISIIIIVRTVREEKTFNLK